MALLLTRQPSVRPRQSIEGAQLKTSRHLWWISSVVPTFRWERRFSTVVGDASRWIGRWIRPMTSLTRRGRIQSGSSSRMQSLQQLLWTAAPSLGPGRFRGIWVMANLAPARCGVTATPRAFQTCPGQISSASPRTIWHAASS